MGTDDGLDSWRSWVIALASAVINFLILAPARLSGQLFVFFMEKYDIDREKASFPFTVCYILRTLSGPLAGFLGERFGLQKLSIVGCVLSTIGIGLCFISEEIISVTIFLGVVYGLGYGFVTSLVPQFLNLHFEQHLSKANGIAMGGACLGAFLLPPLIEYSAHKYGISGMMLIFSGLILHSVPASMMLSRPNFSKLLNSEDSIQVSDSQNLAIDISKTEKNASTEDQFLDVNTLNDTGTLNTLNAAQNSNSSEYYCEKGFSTTDSSKTENNSSIGNIFCSTNHLLDKSCVDITGTLNKINTIQNLTTADYYGKIGFTNPNFIIDSREKASKNYLEDNDINKCLPLIKSLNMVKLPLNNNESKSAKDLSGEDKDFTSVPLVKFKKKKAACGSFSVFLDPVFLLISIIQSTYFFMMFVVWTVIIDFARDKNIDDNEDVYFVMCLSVSDLFGRVGLGCVTDSGFMTKMNFCAASFFLMGIASFLLPFISGFELTFAVVFFYGFISGGIMIVFPGMVVQFISEEKRTMAMASRTILNAPMSVAISPLIGFFRETHGSYNGMFYLVATLSLICAVVSLAVPCLASYREQKKSRDKLPSCQTTSHI